MNVVRYKAPVDGSVKFITGAVVVALGGVAVTLVAGVGQSLYAKYNNPIVLLVPLVFLVVPVIVLVAIGQEAPTGYAIDDDAVRIERRAGAVAIPISTVREVQELPSQAWFVRVGGSGGWFGFYGEFKNRDLGQVTMYATRGDDRVLVATDGRKYVITPESPAAFVADLRARLEARRASTVP